MSTSHPPAPPRQILVLLWCARCHHRLCPESVTAEIRAYQCSNGCRTRPVHGPWLEEQITRVIAGRIRPEHADTVIDRITIGEEKASEMKITWKRHFPAERQPPAAPASAFVFHPRPETT